MKKQNKIYYYVIAGAVLLGFIVLIYSFKQDNKQKKSLIPSEEDPELSKKYNFDLIPDGKNNYRSAQFTADVYPYVIKKYGIKNIIRMNGNGSDSKHTSSMPETSIETEKQICENQGCNFTFINSHEGYKEGKGYTQSLEKVNKILTQGNTLIHCTHGADRTGGMVGGYLMKNKIITDKDKLWEYTTKYNSWNNKIKNDKFFGSGFDKYADTFYPLEELKKSKWVK